MKNKTFTFTVTATICKEDEPWYNTREQVLQELKEWLELNEDGSGLMGSSPFEKIDIE